MPLVADLNNEAQIFACFQQVLQHFGRLGHLNNAAGVMQDSPLVLRQKHGNIVNFGPKAGESESSDQTAYCASKAAVSGLSKVFTKKLGPQGLRVNLIAPDFIDLALTAHCSETQRIQLVSQTALRRLATAAVVGFLCSDTAVYVTGQVLAFDWGLVI